jgi:hypothetical protein
MPIFKSKISYKISYSDQIFSIPHGFQKDDFYDSHSGTSLTSRCWYVAICGIYSKSNSSYDYTKAEIEIQSQLRMNKTTLKELLTKGLSLEEINEIYKKLNINRTTVKFDNQFNTCKQIYDLLYSHGPLILNRKALGSESTHSVVIKGISNNTESNLIEFLDSMNYPAKSVFFDFEDFCELINFQSFEVFYLPRRYFLNFLSNNKKYPSYQ